MTSNIKLNFNNNNTIVFDSSYYCYDNVLSLESVLSVSAEYFLATSILSIAIFFVLLPKVQSKYLNTQVKVFSFISSQLNFLAILIIVLYCFLCTKQHFLFMSEISSFTNSIFNDFTSLFAKLIIGFSSIIYLIFIQRYLIDQKLHYFEYYILILTSILGFCLLCCSNDLLTAYLAIELQGLSFYVLASFKKTSNYSAESGVKYFILGSFSTIIFLLGINLIYGVSGSISIFDFKDLFVWVFSINSFFLSFESLSKAIEFFQIEHTFNNEECDANNIFNLTKLRTIFSNFLILKTDAFVFPSDLDFFFNKSRNLENFDFEENLLLENISANTVSKVDQMNSSCFFFFNNNDNYTELETLVKHEFFLPSVLNNLLIWFLSDMTNQKTDFINFFYFLNYVKEQDQEFDLLNNLNPDWINTIYSNENFQKVSLLTTKETLLNDWSEYLAFVRYNVEEPSFKTLATDEKLKLFMNNNLDCYSQKKVGKNLSNLVSESIEENKHLSNVVTEIFLREKFDDGIPDSSVKDTFSKDINVYMNLANVLSLFPLFFDIFNNSGSSEIFTFDILLVELGLLLILISLFLKLALTPFHLWSPDVYEGSPSSSTFFFVVVSKISIFVFLVKICYLSFYSIVTDWQFYSLFVAVLSILVGSIAALKQRKLKSLLAYSSISNMGLILASFSAGNFEGIKAVFYYFVIYIISGLSIWSIFLAFKLKKKNIHEKYNKDLGDFTLLHESNGVLAYASVITIFTVAGIPPMVGFLAKVSIFLTLIVSSMNFIAFISIITSVISTFYYIRILKVIFFENVLVGKLFYPINSKANVIRSFLFFLMLFFFVSPLVINFFSYKITLFLSKSFY